MIVASVAILVLTIYMAWKSYVYIEFDREQFIDNWSRKIAWLIPSKIVYWCVIRAWAHATTGDHGDAIVSDVRVHEMLKRWE